MLSRLSRAVPPLKTQMVRNLPRTISSRPAGLMSSVSMVPRSFSPAHRSTAGYRAPASDHITSMNGKMRTMRSRIRCGLLPVVLGATAFSSATKGSSKCDGSPRSARRAFFMSFFQKSSNISSRILAMR